MWNNEGWLDWDSIELIRGREEESIGVGGDDCTSSGFSFLWHIPLLQFRCSQTPIDYSFYITNWISSAESNN